MIRNVRRAAACLAIVLTAASAGVSAGQTAGEWRDFQATWSATGRRHTIASDNGGNAAVVDLSGAVVITSGEGLGRGFRGEVIGFDDGDGMSVGRGLWTDERGDRIFIRLDGEPIEGGRRITATITGGTGRYSAIEGEVAFTWQYVIAGEGDRTQGRAVNLAGRVRRAGTQR